MHIPHEEHIGSVIWIRLVLAPELEPLSFDDVSRLYRCKLMLEWPFDISDYLVSGRIHPELIHVPRAMEMTASDRVLKCRCGSTGVVAIAIEHVGTHLPVHDAPV